MTDHLAGDGGVILKGDSIKSSCGPGFRHNTAGDDMQRVKLDTVRTGFHHFLQRVQRVLLPFPGQTDNQVRADFQTTLAGEAGRLLITGEIVATVNTVQRFIIRRLQTELQPDFITLLPITAQQVQHAFRYAVRARSHA